MKRALMFVICLLLFAQFISAHTIEKESIIRSAGEYNVQFSTEPDFPLTGRPVHMNFEVWDHTGQVLTDLNLKIELRSQEKSIHLDINKKADHFDVEYIFDEAGEYTIIPSINDKQLDTSFTIYVDNFGKSGLIRISVIIFFLLILLLLMYKDCRKK